MLDNECLRCSNLPSLDNFFLNGTQSIFKRGAISLMFYLCQWDAMVHERKLDFEMLGIIHNDLLTYACT